MSVYNVKKKKRANKRDGRAKLLSVFFKIFFRRSCASAVAKAVYFLSNVGHTGGSRAGKMFVNDQFARDLVYHAIQ